MLNMILAESDEDYIFGIGRFISVMCRSMFNVSIFTTVRSFNEHMAGCRENTDVLIAGEEFVADGISDMISGSVIILTEDLRTTGQAKCGDRIRRVRKYQRADCLVGEIIEILSDEIDSIPLKRSVSQSAPVVAMCSPCGGSGTTLVSVNLAQCMAELGMKVMYVNFENLPSSRFFFRDDSNTRNFSNVIYSLKLAQKNMNLKIENSGSFNNEFSISYFKPQSCFLEMDEVEESDCLKLFDCLRENGKYDVIIVDIGSGLNRRGTAVMKISDLIGVVMLNDALALHKNRTFADQIRMIFDSDERIFEKLMLFNNCRSEKRTTVGIKDESPLFGKCADEFEIPYVADLYVRFGNELVYNMNNAMKSSLAGAAKSFAENLNGHARVNIGNQG